jgi:hypothetical protein
MALIDQVVHTKFETGLKPRPEPRARDPSSDLVSLVEKDFWRNNPTTQSVQYGEDIKYMMHLVVSINEVSNHGVVSNNESTHLISMPHKWG